MNDRFSMLRYANCWEDAEIVLEGLQIGENDVGLSVASGGDNTLALLLKHPKKIYAFDINPTQIYCTELKMACIRLLPYERTLAFLGVGDCDRLKVYAAVRGELSEAARAYFDGNRKTIRKGLIHAGKFEHYFRLFRKFVIPLFSTRKNFHSFSRLQNTDEQLEFYGKKIDNRRLKALFGIYFGSKVMGKLGRDKSFYDYVEDEKQTPDDLKARFEYGISHVENRSNPYLNYIANNTFTDDCLSIYLQRENYETIRRNLDRIELIHGNLLSVRNMTFDFFNLSDIFEYMSEEEFEKNVGHLETLAGDNARIAYWNMQNKRYLKSESFTFEKELSERLFQKSKSYFYRDFSVYTVRKRP